MARMNHHFIPRARRPRQHHRAVNRMLQLAHVARPAVAEQMRSRPRAKHHAGQPHFETALFAEITRQQHHVVSALTQRRHGQREHAQAMEQVGAELPGQHRFAQIPVGRSKDPHVHPQAAVIPHALDVAVLQYAQQLGLK